MGIGKWQRNAWTFRCMISTLIYGALLSITSHSHFSIYCHNYTGQVANLSPSPPFIFTSSSCVMQENSKEALFLYDGAISSTLICKIQAYFSHHQTRIHTTRTVSIHSDGIIPREFEFLTSRKKKRFSLTSYNATIAG